MKRNGANAHARILTSPRGSGFLARITHRFKVPTPSSTPSTTAFANSWPSSQCRNNSSGVVVLLRRSTGKHFFLLA